MPCHAFPSHVTDRVGNSAHCITCETSFISIIIQFAALTSPSIIILKAHICFVPAIATVTMQKASGDRTTAKWYKHSTADRISTKTVIVTELKKQYPNLHVTITSSSNLIAYAAFGHADYKVISDEHGDFPASIADTEYIPPARRLDPSPGYLIVFSSFAKYMYTWKGHDFIVYFIEGAEAGDAYSITQNYYILSTDQQKSDELLLAVGKWSNDLHKEILVFDDGYWQKSSQLYESVMKSSWDAVILNADMKKAIIDDHLSFYSSRETYDKLKVSWKRGIIYHGPPGNGKTISIKATMKMLYQLKEPIPTLYVRSLSSVSIYSAQPLCKL